MRLRQIAGVTVAEGEESAEENEEGEDGKGREGPPLKAKGLPKDGNITERVEPEEVNPVRNGGTAANNEDKLPCSGAAALAAEANRWFRA
jgi:hypothetical protein